MSLTELLPALHSLPRADKLRLMQLLVADLAQEEGVALVETEESYPIWAPYDAFGAAATLLHALEDERLTGNG
jgi:hypothetical protein